MSTPVDADTLALARLGARVRARLEANAAVQKIPAERVEMFILPDFLVADECGHMIAMIDLIAQPSRVFDPENPIRYRTSHSSDFDPADPFIIMIDQRICELMGIARDCGESLQGQRYLSGQEFHGHHDWFRADSGHWPQEQARGGQRSWTAMVYLNDVKAGGHTNFSRIGISIAPQPGMLLVWNNALPDGLPHEDTLHAALPVTSGRKYIITKWFRARKWG